MAAGFVSQNSLTAELNRRGIPAAYGGSWHRTSVLRVLKRLDELAGNDATGLALKRPADVRAEALGLTIHKLQKAGFVSIKAIVRELNEREIPTATGGKWHRTSVRRLLQRLERLDRPSSRVT
jgi:beta-phosphoglucomutase-like phosphatase (HAD superfamily)